MDNHMNLASNDTGRGGQIERETVVLFYLLIINVISDLFVITIYIQESTGLVV